MGAVELATQTIENLIIAHLEDKIGLTERINRTLRTLRAMRFTIHTGLKVNLFEFRHCRKLRTELTKIVKNNMSFLSDWTALNVSVPPNQIPIYVA